MKAAPIELTNYFVSELQFAANHKFDPQLPSTVPVADLQVTQQAVPKPDDKREWQITRRIALNSPPERNCPYSFLLDMVGFIRVTAGVKDESVERHAQITGTSLIFSAAREIIRAVTSRGPYKGILLPTITFWEPKPIPQMPVTPAPETETTGIPSGPLPAPDLPESSAPELPDPSPTLGSPSVSEPIFQTDAPTADPVAHKKPRASRKPKE